MIEAVSGVPYQEYIQRNIFDPLGMAHSYFNISPPALARDRSNNYFVSAAGGGQDAIKANGREFDTGITTPNGGLNAPLGDLARWVAFLTGAGAASNSILSRSSLEEMWRPVVAVSTTPGHIQNMGLSFFLDFPQRASGPIKLVEHTGSQAGFRAFMIFNPQSRRAVIAAFNTSCADGQTRRLMKRARHSRDGFNSVRERSLDLLQ